MGRLTERIIAVLMALFLLVYVGYQAYRYYYKPVSTETVFEYNVNHSVVGEGIAIRDEMVLEQTVRGVENYLFEDAERATVGQTVAEFYRSSTGDKNIKRARELEEEIRLLREAQDTTVQNFGNTEIYNRDIKDQLGRLSLMSGTGRYQELPDMRQNLTSLVNKKLISTGKAQNYSARISELEAQLEGLERTTMGETLTTVAAPVSGYFSRTVDGYENRVTAASLEDYALEDYLRFIDQKPPSGMGGKAGKMVLSQNWHFAAAVSKDDVEWVKLGQAAQLQFDQIQEAVPVKVADIIDHKDNDTAVLLFRCSRMNEELINLRVSGVVIRFEQYTGLRINASDLRFVDNQRGVYVLEDNIIRFRLIDLVYEEQSFILSQTYYVDDPKGKGYVKLFDQIARGNDLYDGKPIHDY